MTFVQKKGNIPTKNQRKGGYLNFKDLNQQLQGLKTELELRENADELSEGNSVQCELPATIKRRVIYEGTYKMSPDERFPVSEVEIIIAQVLKEIFEKEVYDIKTSKELSKTASQTIKDRVKGLNGFSSRFKLVVVVHVGEARSQDIKIASRCLWNEEFDTYATASLRNQSLFTQGTVFGIYFE